MTPMMEQYFGLKEKHKDAILMFRLGDFFEIFFEDAVVASRELEIALTGRDWGREERAPMCGVPAHAVENYIARLVEKGYRVAIADQMEDAKPGKLVQREITRLVTPGTVTDATRLDEGKYNYLAAVSVVKKGFALAAADITTGHFFATVIAKDNEQALIDELARLSPVETVLTEDFPYARIVESVTGKKPTFGATWTFQPANAYKTLITHFGTFHLEGFGLAADSPEISVAGGLLAYISETQKGAVRQITNLRVYNNKAVMALDASSRRNLELTASARDNGKKGSLLWVIDCTKTAMGARLLRAWVESPLVRTTDIQKRLDSVEEWLHMHIERAEMREYLDGIHDMERVITRLASRNGTARDLAVLRNSLEHFPEIERLLKYTKTQLNTKICNKFDNMRDIYAMIEGQIVELPPAGVKEGGMIRQGVNGELDDLRKIKDNAEEILQEMEARERTETGIPLKIKYNRVFGYYIEVTNTHIAKVPERFTRRQTLANAERYVTEELKELEETLLGADEKIFALEYDLFDQLRREIVDNIQRVQYAAGVIASIDALLSLAETAEHNNYIKPEVNNSNEISIEGGRHPVIEKMIPHGFVPNDANMSEETRLAVITGPNMAGKSTYMRQNALIVLMAQIGSFVPAKKARIAVADRIFTRVGAADDLATGQSTFMVEMTEVANILNNATEKSFILLDEIGRGTSTYDGLAIAWAVIEHISSKTKAKTMFATHYHELTKLEGQVDGFVNYCFTAQEQGADFVFLRKLVRGTAGKSYGIHVARLAGLPGSVVLRARKLLEELANE